MSQTSPFPIVEKPITYRVFIQVSKIRCPTKSSSRPNVSVL